MDYLVRAADERGDKLSHEYIVSNTLALVGALRNNQAKA
jgi:hypothetical protein